ncbi:hypothetical protein Tco_0528206 [Tanacetum coccineum]
MVDAQLSTRLEDSINKAFRSYIAEFEKKAKDERNRYIDLVEKSVKEIIKDEVTSQLPQILPKEVSDYATPVTQSTITESLENIILAKSLLNPNQHMKQLHHSLSAQEHKDIYDALVKSYKLDKDLFESYGKVYSLKRDKEDKDKDKDPPAGSDQGLKKRNTSKDAEPSRGYKLKESKSSSSKGSKSQLKSSGKSTQAEEPVFETADTEMPLNQGDDLGDTDDKPNVKEASRDDWFKKPKRPPTLDSDWNTTKIIDFRPPQTWISKIVKAGKPPLTFDELMSTPINFSAYVLNNLKIENLTQEHLVGPAFNLLKGTCRSREIHDFYNKTKAAKYDTIEGIEDTVPSLWSPVKVAYGDFPRVNLHDIEDMLLLLVQKKLSNMERDVIYDLNVALRIFTRHVVILKSNITNMIPYTTYNNPQGIIYLDKLRRNMLMRSDELYKFCDGTLTYVRRVLHDIASSLSMGYFLKRRWSKLDRKRSRIMIKAIDQQLFERRLIRNLEKFVGGREYGEDFSLLERTI